MKNYKTFSNFLLFLLIIGITFFIVVQYSAADYTHFIIWGDRELTRARDLGELFQVFGSEFTARLGERTPGGGMYYLLWALQQINGSILFIYYVYLTLYFIAAVAIFDIGRRMNSSLAGAIATAVFLTSLVSYGIVGKVWNPLFGYPFAVFGYYFFFLYLEKSRVWQIVVSIIFVALAAQAHMSNTLLIPALITVAIIVVREQRLYRTLVMVATVFIAYAPYLGYQAGLVNAENYPDPSVIQAGAGVAEVATRGALFVDSDRAGLWDLIRFIVAEAPLGESFQNSYSRHKLTLHLPYAAILLAMVVFFGYRDKNLHHGATGGNDQKIAFTRHPITLILGLMVIVVVLAFVAFTMGAGGLTIGLWGYYSGQTVPLAALLSGIAIAELFVLKHPWSRWYTMFFRLCAAVAFIVVVSRMALFGYEQIRIADSEDGFGHKLDSRYAYRTLADKEDMFRDLNATFGLSSDQIKERVATIGDWQSGWKFYREPSDYQLGYLDLPEAENSYSGCVFVLSPEARQPGVFAPPEEIKRLLTSFEATDRTPIGQISYESVVQIRSVKIDNIVYRDKYTMAAAQMPNGGCPKSFVNDYILTDEEWLIRQTIEKIEPDQVTDGKVIPVTLSGTLASAIIRQTLPDLAYPFDMLIKITGNDGVLRASLHSKQLRNWSSLNGYWQAVTVENPTLEFVNLMTGEKTNYLLFDGALGLSGIRTPWLGNPFQLPPGDYAVFFKAATVGKTNDMYWHGNRKAGVRIRILVSFQVP